MTIKIKFTAKIAKEMNTNNNFNEFVIDCINRHLSSDWGDVSERDAELNASDFFHALSCYQFTESRKICIRQDGTSLTVLYHEEV